MRLFVALDLPAAARSGLAAWADEAAPAAVRRVPVGNLHVTLAFLGSRDADEAAAIGSMLAAVARPLEPLLTADALWLPPRRPGSLTVALQANAALSGLQSDLVAALEHAIGFAEQRREFRPHVTVGRVPRGTRIDPAGALDPAPPQLSFQPSALTLYRSHTGGGGTRYEPLERVASR